MVKIKKGDIVRIVGGTISGREDRIGQTSKVIHVWSDGVVSVLEKDGREGAYPLKCLENIQERGV